MARQTSEQRLQKIHAEALREFDAIQAAVREVRLQCLEDRRFYSIAGAQWEGAVGDQFAKKVRFEFNQVHLAMIRLFSEYRNNRITVDFTPKDGSHEDDEMADTCDGLYRADEKACTAEEAYDNCYEEGTGGGFGAWRLRAGYEDDYDDENTKQRVRIEPIFDADTTVFFDLDAKRQDKSDAKRCYVLTSYTPEAYREEWQDNPSDWGRDISRTEFDWCTPDIVWVCELYKVEEKTELVHYFRGLIEDEPEMRVTQAELDADPEKLDFLAATGFTKVREKRAKRRVVHKYILCGGKVLEDCGLIPGTEIPVVPYFGKRWVVDGIERCMGHVRLAKDAQRLSNMLLSWLAEMAARFDIEKPIVTPEQMKGHAVMWARDNIDKFPYLLLNAQVDAEGMPVPGSAAPTAYTRAPNIPPAMAALVQIAQQALQDLLGNQKAGEQLQPNLSGKAVELIQNRLDMQVFIYMSNLAKAMKRSGQIWLSMMKDLAVEKNRRMKTVGVNGESGSVVLNQPAYDVEKNQQYDKNDLSKAQFEVDVEVGPSSSSKRAATVRALIGVMQHTQDPETQQVLTGMVLMNLEGEGMGDVRAWARQKLLRMGVVKPTEEESADLANEKANSKPSPQDAALLGMAEESSANAAAARSKTVLNIANADKATADAAKTRAETVGEEQDQQIAGAEALRSILQPDLGGGSA